MDKPPPAAATMQSCLQRLQYLQSHFQNIGSPAELADAEREGGHILALLLQGKHIEPDTLIPNSRDLLLDYAAGALDWQPMDNGLAEHYQLSLWTFLAMRCSVQPRVVLHDAGPAPVWTVTRTIGTTTDTQKIDTGVRLKTTDRAKDFRQQGKRYSLWVSELLTRIQAAPPEQPNGSPDAKGKQGYNPDELHIAIAGVILDKSQVWTAKKMADEINRKCTDRTIGPTKIGKHPTFKAYLKEKRKRRAGRNTGKPKTITTSGPVLDSLVNPNRRKTKPINPDDRDDDY
jgi:hypothetical protein